VTVRSGDFEVNLKTGTIFHIPTGYAWCVLDPKAKVPVLAHIVECIKPTGKALTADIRNGVVPAWIRARDQAGRK
jgi:hypothetical protein